MTTTETISGLPTNRPNPLDPPEEIARLRTDHPIVRMRFPDGHLGWLVTSHSAVRAVLANAKFSNRADRARLPVEAPRTFEPGAIEIPPGLFSRMDPPEHTRYRRMLTGQFTVRRMNRLMPRIEQIAEDHLDEMERHGPPADLVTMFAQPIPALVICELLGVPYEHHDQFQRDSLKLFDLQSSQEDIATAFTSLAGLLAQLVEAKRATPGEDLLSGLIGEGELSTPELVTIGVILLVAGHETTANMLGLGTYTLLQNPEQLALLRDDPSLIEGAVEELMRYLSVIHIGPIRNALEDVEIEGVLIKAGESVAVSVPGANRDPGRYESPDRLDLTRSAQGHVGFGHGIHQCLGQQLARIEMRAGFTALFRRFPRLRLAVPASEIPMRTTMSIYGVHKLPVTWTA
jgi:cytochrome P450